MPLRARCKRDTSCERTRVAQAPPLGASGVAVPAKDRRRAAGGAADKRPPYRRGRQQRWRGPPRPGGAAWRIDEMGRMGARRRTARLGSCARPPPTAWPTALGSPDRRGELNPYSKLLPRGLGMLEESVLRSSARVGAARAASPIISRRSISASHAKPRVGHRLHPLFRQSPPKGPCTSQRALARGASGHP